MEEYLLLYIYDWGPGVGEGGSKIHELCFKDGLPFQVENNHTGKLILWEVLFFLSHGICFTAVKPGIHGLAFTMGKGFLTDNLARVGRILMIISADPHEILIMIKW